MSLREGEVSVFGGIMRRPNRVDDMIFVKEKDDHFSNLDRGPFLTLVVGGIFYFT